MNSLFDEHDDALDEFGISGQDETIAISQGSKLTGSMKMAKLKLADKTLRHSRAKMGEKWLFSMFEEKEIIYDTITQGWFVPVDFMIDSQALPNLSIALGAARSLYASYPPYKNTVYGRLKFTY